MEAKINVAEILKDKPENTKLYSPLFGDVYFSYIENSIINVKHHGGITKFFDNSRYYNYPESEPLLFPSKEMRDWSKFAWKRGDVLVSDDGCIEVIFDKWYDDTYTSFYGKHYLDSENENDIVYFEAFICTTERFSLEDKESFLCYINTIEERLGGKLNLETLEIEKQPEFKDGDILYITDRIESCNYILIYKNQEGRYIYRYATMFEDNFVIMTEGGFLSDNGGLSKRYATEEEKQQLFETLAKKGKAWDAEKKQIVDLKPKWTPKPFDKVLVRNTDTEEWFPGFFEKFDSTWNNPYHIMNRRSMTDFAFKQCIPYEGNEHLLGTTNNVDG